MGLSRRKADWVQALRRARRLVVNCRVAVKGRGASGGGIWAKMKGRAQILVKFQAFIYTGLSQTADSLLPSGSRT